MKRLGWNSPKRRVVINPHDLRFGIFYIKRHGVWLHIPGLVIRLRDG